jgi:hypothetical protein
MATNRVQVEVGANVKGFQEGMNEATKSAEQYETETRKVADAQVNLMKELKAAKKEVQNLAAGYAKLDDEAKKSAFGQEMARQLEIAKQKAAEYIDLQGDLNTELKNMASDTAVFDTVSDGFSALGSTMSAVTGVMGIFTDNTELMTKAVTYFTTAESIAAAAIKAKNLLQKQSSLMLGIGKIQQSAATAAVELDTVAKGKNAVATGAATAAQKALNAVAKANPYILLASAVLTVVSAVALFTSGDEDAEKAQKTLNDKLAEGTQRALEYANAMYSASQAVTNFISQTGGASWEVENAKIKAEAENVRILSQQYLNLKRAKGESVEDYEKREKEAYDRLKTAQDNLVKVKREVQDNRRAVQYLIDNWNKFKTEKQINAAISAMRNLRSEYVQGSKEYNELGRRIEILQKKLNPTKTTGPKKTTGNTKKEIEAAANSIADLEKQISDLQDRAKKGALPEELNDPAKFKAKINALQRQVKDLKIKWGFEEPDTKLKELEDKVEKFKHAFIMAVDTNDQQAADAAKKAYKAAQKELNDYKLTIDLEPKDIAKAGSLKEAQEQVSKYKIEVEASVKGTPEYDEAISNLKKWQSREQEIRLKIDAELDETKKGSLEWLSKQKQKYQAIFEASIVGSAEWNDAFKKINELTKQEKKIELAIEFKGMNTLEKAFAMLDGFHAIDNIVGSFESLTQAIDEDANAWDIFMASIQAMESIMEGINTVTQIYNMLSGLSAASKLTDAAASEAAATATATEAAAQTAAEAPAIAATAANKALEASYLDLASAMIFAAHASIPFAGVGIASGFVSTMLSMQAAVKATTKAMMAFAYGGIVGDIVGGSSYSGDRILARVNSGEMILNKRQQKNLFDLLDSDTIPNAGGANVTVHGVIHGSDLILVQKNTNKIRSKAGTSIKF